MPYVPLEALLPGWSQISIRMAEHSSLRPGMHTEDVIDLKLPDKIVRIAVPDTWWSPSITSVGTF